MNADVIELKLRIDAQALKRIKSEPLPVKHNDTIAPLIKAESVYWDTLDLALARQGIFVSLRSVGAVKIQMMESDRLAGPFALRRTRQWPVADLVPDRSLISLAEPLEASTLHHLTPQFTIKLESQSFSLGEEDGEARLCLEWGEIRTKGETIPFAQAVLQSIRGAPALLYPLARQIMERVPAKIDPLSTPERGALALAHDRRWVFKAPGSPLSPEMGVAAAFQVIAHDCIAHFLLSEERVRHEAVGPAIHQMRVSLRRLRSAMRVFRDVVDGPGLAEARTGIRWLLEHLGPARDSQVFLDEIVAPVAAAYPDNVGLQGLKEQWLEQHAQACDAALKALESPRFTATVLALAEWIDAGDWLERPPPVGLAAVPVIDFARKVLARQSRRLRRQGGKVLGKLEPEALHLTRIRAKQLRYAGEFFAPFFASKRARDFLRRLAKLQDTLGEINDIEVAGARLAGRKDTPTRAWAQGLIAGWHSGRRGALLEKAERDWKRYRQSKPFWED